MTDLCGNCCGTGTTADGFMCADCHGFSAPAVVPVKTVATGGRRPYDWKAAIDAKRALNARYGKAAVYDVRKAYPSAFDDLDDEIPF